jgi:hypothetical protein
MERSHAEEMSTAEDRFMNEILVTGALYAALHEAIDSDLCQVAIATDEDGQYTNALWIWFDFMKSRYRLTVTMDPEEEKPATDDMTQEERRRSLDLEY